MIVDSPMEFIFRDLFYRVRGYAGGEDLFLKLEGFNVTGSIKVKTAIGLIEDLERKGLAKPHETVIIESSSGNLGVALSMVCGIKGYKFICVTDANATRANIRAMELYGAEVIVVSRRRTKSRSNSRRSIGFSSARARRARSAAFQESSARSSLTSKSLLLNPRAPLPSAVRRVSGTSPVSARA